MTDQQALQIRTLRQQGLGYHAIAGMIGLSRDSVRGYCKNHGLDGIQLNVKMNTKERIKNGEACAYCAGPIKKKDTGRPRRFCSEICRRSYWRVHRKEEGIKHADHIYTMECAYCHETFESYANKSRKYCCHGHYILDRYGKEA